MTDPQRAWDVFTAGLMDVLGVLGSHDVVALSARSAREVTDAFHVTVGTDAAAGEIRAYATGPASEPEPLPLSAGQQARLLELGWSAPDASATGAEEHTHFVVRRFPFDGIEQRGRFAAMLVATLREAYGFATPDDVVLCAVIPNDAVTQAIAEVVDLLALARAPR